MADLDPVAGDAEMWELSLPRAEALLVERLPDEMEDLLAHPERSRRVIDRLFPRTHDDPEDEAEHRRLLGDALLDERRELLRQVRVHLQASRRRGGGRVIPLRPPDADVWLRFVNDLRLVVATDLGVESDLQDERRAAGAETAPRYALLDYLAYLEVLLLRMLSSR